ncbi:Uncharacterised protein [Porphyromonas cangingivalis]|nr:Uncharacterised protein [Porphyromonas cangingivalis]
MVARAPNMSVWQNKDLCLTNENQVEDEPRLRPADLELTPHVCEPTLAHTKKPTLCEQGGLLSFGLPSTAKRIEDSASNQTVFDNQIAQRF